jgi:ABC-type lipoprotein release transport system permease subunit
VVLILVVLLALLAGVVAAISPARRAARVDILRQLQPSRRLT